MTTKVTRVTLNGHAGIDATRRVAVVMPDGKQRAVTARTAARLQRRYRGPGYGPVAIFR